METAAEVTIGFLAGLLAAIGFWLVRRRRKPMLQIDLRPERIPQEEARPDSTPQPIVASDTPEFGGHV
jgi:LPXTG-motif cell wall-anchored protein